MQLDAFETLADPTRRRILARLRDGERPVGEIVRDAGIHQSGVSRHLKILHDAGFVSVRPDGQRRLYALRPEPFRELEAWLGDYRKVWEARLDRFGAALEANRTKADDDKERSKP
jgi:DNA-binding transcriptional ArsR family regulator